MAGWANNLHITAEIKPFGSYIQADRLYTHKYTHMYMYTCIYVHIRKYMHIY